MQIIDYKYVHGTESRGDYIAIPDLDLEKPSVSQFIRLAELEIELDRPTAFIYINGVSLAPSDTSLHTVITDAKIPIIKSTAAYIAHQWVGTMKNVEHLHKVEVISGTCAAGVQAIYEAERMFWDGIEDVVIIGHERTSADTLQLFHELQIPVVCGEGFVYMKVRNGGNQIHNAMWNFAYNRNPFAFTEEQINRLIPSYPVDFVKLHGTGTPANEAAEATIARFGVPLRYKDMIGHTQGISALLETCMVLDNLSISGRILILANGLGGYYGAFTLEK